MERVMDRKEQMARDCDAFSRQLDEHADMTTADWFKVAWAREIPEPLPVPMPVGDREDPEWLPTLNLGAGFRHIGGSVPLDYESGWDADTMPIPYKDSSIAGIWAHGFFEHVKDPRAVLAECQRVLVTGGVLNIVVPHGLSDLYVEDIDHKHPFSEETWRNIFSNPYYDATAKTGVPWQLEIHTCFIMGVVWRNLALFTQLVKKG